MELILIRKYFTDTYTIGKLSEEQKYLCDTLEDKVRDLNDINHDGDFDESGEGKEYGKTAIPYGRYRIVVNYSPKLKRVLPLLSNVPGYAGIRIHGGKNSDWTLGCILVGENKIKGGLINFAFWETYLLNLIKERIKNKEEVWITIKQ
jgi:hypothetical protein